MTAPGVARMTLPDGFVRELVALCLLVLDSTLVDHSLADALVGKAGRVAHVLPLARPFVAPLYAALAACQAAAACNTREAPPGQVACRRFYHGARMLLRLLHFRDRVSPIPNSRDAPAEEPPQPDPDHRRIEVGASPWGEVGC